MSYEIVFYALVLSCHYFMQYGLCILYLFFCLSALFLISACLEFDVLFINFCNICISIIYIVDVTCFCSDLSLFTFKQFVRKDTRHKNLIIALELLGFKNFIFKEKFGTFTNWESIKEALSPNIFFEKI